MKRAAVPFIKQVMLFVLCTLCCSLLSLFFISSDFDMRADHVDASLLRSINQRHTEIAGNLLNIFASPGWWPLLVIVLAYVLYAEYGRSVWRTVLIALCLSLFAYLIASWLIKPFFARTAPIYQLGAGFHLFSGVHTNDYSFISASSAAAFAFALFLTLAMDSRIRWLKPFLWCYALLIAADRVYTGLHFPGDVLGSLIFGSGLAYITYLLYAVAIDLIPFE